MRLEKKTTKAPRREQDPMDEDISVRATRRRRPIWIGGRYSPLSIIMLAFGLFDLAPFVLRSLFWVAEVLGVAFPRMNVGANHISLCVNESCHLQKAMLAIWFVFGPGSWWARFPITWLSACGLAIGMPILGGIDKRAWTDVVRSTAGLPFELLAWSAPLVAWRLWGGHILRYQGGDSLRGDAPPARSRHVSICELMAVTAVVAVATQLSHWSDWHQWVNSPHPVLGWVQNRPIFGGYGKPAADQVAATAELQDRLAACDDVALGDVIAARAGGINLRGDQIVENVVKTLYLV